MKDRVKELRKSLGLTLEKFGEKLGVGKNAISRIETGKSNLTDQMLKSICNVNWNGKYVNEKWLRYNIGSMFQEPPDFSLDDYANRNNLTDREREIVRGFMELEPKLRNAIYDIFDSTKHSSKSSIYDEAPDDPAELERLYGDGINSNAS